MRLGVLLLVFVATPARADELDSPRMEGDHGVRPFVGVSGNLGIGERTAFDGAKFVFGADYLFGTDAAGLKFAPGIHAGIGGGVFILQPLLDIQYRFQLPIPIYLWVGGGASLKLGFGRYRRFHIGLTFRVVGGLEYFITDSIGVSTQLAVLDLGPLFAPFVTAIGAIEWIIGPHFRF